MVEASALNTKLPPHSKLLQRPLQQAARVWPGMVAAQHSTGRRYRIEANAWLEACTALKLHRIKVANLVTKPMQGLKLATASALNSKLALH